MLKEELPHAQIRLFNEPGVSFHPKAWIFHYDENHPDEVIIGSSNLSRSALINGVKWNGALHGQNVLFFADRFNRLYEKAVVLDEQTLESYSKSWIHPRLPQIESLKKTSRTIDCCSAAARCSD